MTDVRDQTTGLKSRIRCCPSKTSIRRWDWAVKCRM